MLHNVIENGTGQKASIDEWAAGKTGTTQSYRDAWFVGWSDDLATAVWFGYPQAQVPMTEVHGIKVTGGSFPAQIWGRYMKVATGRGAPPKRRRAARRGGRARSSAHVHRVDAARQRPLPAGHEDDAPTGHGAAEGVYDSLASGRRGAELGVDHCRVLHRSQRDADPEVIERAYKALARKRPPRSRA